MHRDREFQGRQAGFTLVEALVAMLVLTFGLIAITNLFIVASSSNSVANHSTAVAAQAAEVMERIKAVRFTDLQVGGELDLEQPLGTFCDPAVDPDNCFPSPLTNFSMVRAIDGVGFVKIKWQVVNPAAGGPGTMFVIVRAQSDAPLAGARSRAEFTTFRTCTLASTCP